MQSIITRSNIQSVKQTCLRFAGIQTTIACQQRWLCNVQRHKDFECSRFRNLCSIERSGPVLAFRHHYCTKPTAYSFKQSQQNSRQTTPPPASSKKHFLWIALASAIAGVGLAYIFYKPNEKTTDNKSKPVKKNVPATSDQIPKKVPYLLIGGGTASFAAFRAIKSHDPKAKVLVVTREHQIPYMRPPLSKEIWRNEDSDLKFRQWNGAQRSLFFEPEDFYVDPTKLLDEPNGGVAVVRGYTVDYIDVPSRKAVLTDGTEIEYDECLLATGSEPENLSLFKSAPLSVRNKITLFKTIDDFQNLKKTLENSSSVAIIGGGFLGSELACALTNYRDDGKVKVYQIFPEKGNMGKILPEYLSQWSTERVKEEGVNVIPKTQVTNVQLENSKVKLTLHDNTTLLVDHVIVAIGSRPDVRLAEKSGLEVDSKYGGYLVNAELEARRHLYVAGDAASFYDVKLGRRRVEHHDHAVVSGRLAGENMVGKKKPFTHQSMFWSDLGPRVGYEAIGLVDASLPTVGVFAKRSDTETATITDNVNTEKAELVNSKADPEDESYNKGVVFYLQNEKVVGIVLWNVFNRINTARSIIAEGKKFDDLNEVAKLFEMHA